MKKDHWDLTNRQGVNAATLKYFGYALFPYISVLGLAGKLIDGVRSFMMDTVATPDQQKQAAIDIIRAAREANAEEVEFTMDQEVAVGLNMNVDGAKFEFGPKRGGKMRVKVKFK